MDFQLYLECMAEQILFVSIDDEERLATMADFNTSEFVTSTRLFSKKVKSPIAVRFEQTHGTPAAPASMGGMPNPSAKAG